MEIPSTQILDDFLPDDSPQSSPEKKKQVGTLRIQGSSYPIFTGENRIGRDPKMCSIVLDGKGQINLIQLRKSIYKALSAEHAIIEAHTTSSVFIYDLESTNKTRLGKMILKPQIRYQLQDNAQVYFADILATYHQLAKHNSSVESMDSSKEGDFFIPETPSDNMCKKPGDRFCVVESPSDDSIIESSQPVREESTSLEPSSGVRKHIIFGEVKDETALESICEAATQLDFESFATPDICEAPTQCLEADFDGKLNEEASKSETADICDAPTQADCDGKLNEEASKSETADICDAPTQCLEANFADKLNEEASKSETADICDAPTQADCAGKGKEEAPKSVAVNEDVCNVPTQCLEGSKVVSEVTKQLTLTEEKSDSDTDPEEVFGDHDEKNSSVADDSMTDIFNAPTQLVGGEYSDQNKKEEDQSSHETLHSISKASEPQNTNIHLDISSTENNVLNVPESPKEFDEVDDLFDSPTQQINCTKHSDAQEENNGKEKTVDPEPILNEDLSQAPTQIISKETLEFEFVKPESRKCKEAEKVTATSLNANADQNGLPVIVKNKTECEDSVAQNGKGDVKVIELNTKNAEENCDSDLFDAPTQLINEDYLFRKNQSSPLEKTESVDSVKDDTISTKPDQESIPKQKDHFKFGKPVDSMNEEMKAPAELDGVSDAPTQLLPNTVEKQLNPLEKIENVDCHRKISDNATLAKPESKANVTEVSSCVPKQKDSVNKEMKESAEPDTECDLFDAPTQLIDDSYLLSGKHISPSERTENVGSDGKTLKDDATFSKPDSKMNDKAMTEVPFSDENAPDQEENVEFAKPVDSVNEETKVEPDSDSDLYDAPTQILRSEPQHDAVASTSSETAPNISISAVRNEDAQTPGLSKAKGDRSSEDAWSHSGASGNGCSEKNEGETTKFVEGEVNSSKELGTSNDQAPSQSVRGDDGLCEAESEMLHVTTSGIPSLVIDNKDDIGPGRDVEIPSRVKGDLNENLCSTDICIDIFHEQKEVSPPLKKSQARVYTNRAKQRTDDEILEAQEQSMEEAESGEDTGDTGIEEVTSSPILKQNHVRKRSANVPSPPEKKSELQEGIASPVIQNHSHLKRKGPATYSNRNKRLKVESDSTLPETFCLLDSESRIPVLTRASPQGRRKKRETEASPHSTPRKTRDSNSSKQIVKKSKGDVTKRSQKVKEYSEEGNKLVKGVEVKRGDQELVARKREVSLKKDKNKSKKNTTMIPDSRRSSRRTEIKIDESKSRVELVERKKMLPEVVKQKNIDLSPSKSRLKVESKVSSRQVSSVKDSGMSPSKSRLKVESETSPRRVSSLKGSGMSPSKSRLKVESKVSSRRVSSVKDSGMSSSKSRLKVESETSPRRVSSLKDSGQKLPRTTRKRALAPPAAKQEPENKYDDLSDSTVSHSSARRTSNRRAKHVEEVNTDFVYTSTSRNNSPNLSKKRKQDDTESESSQSEPLKTPKASRSQRKEAPATPQTSTSRSNKRKLSESEVVASPKRVRGSSRLNESVTSGVEGSPTRAKGRGNNNYKVLFTGVTCTKEDEEFVKKLGGSVVDTPDACTVLVTDKVRRTYKFLCITGMGKPVVSLEWLKRSRQSGSFLDPWQFIVKDVDSEKKFSFSLHDSLKVASQHQLLAGYSVMVTSSVKPPPPEMKGIITSSGGKILTRNPGNNWPEKSFTISCPDDKSQWSKVKKGGRPIVGAEVLLLGVLQQKLDLKTHALQ